MGATKLTDNFLKTYEISDIIEEKPKSGQKQVYIVKIDNINYALKVISTVDKRIIRELEIYDKYKHLSGIPNIIRIDSYESDLIVIEEYIDGQDLNNICNSYLSDSLKIRKLIYDIATILTPIWKDKYVHRDLKPRNIIIRPDGTPVVLDFGIARDLDNNITPTGRQPYSWPFACPEQLFDKKEQILYRSDFFCLGIIAFFLYTGKYPFGNSENDVAECFMKPQKTFDLNDKEINTFLNSVLKYNVAERPRTIEQFIKSLNI